MSTTLFSQHSSNPLEVGSSDLRNRAYHTTLRNAEAGTQPYNITISSEGSGSAADYAVRKYWEQVSVVTQGTTTADNTAELDINMDGSDDETMLDATVNAAYIHEPEDQSSDEEAEAEAQSTEGASRQSEDDVSDDGDCPSSEDEERSLFRRPPLEQEEIIDEMQELAESVPHLTTFRSPPDPDDESHYCLLDRLGTGTFSSVYKAIDLHYHDWDNDPWHGFHPESSSAHYQSTRRQENKVFVAIKRIYVTSSPERIRNEIAILKDCRGCRHVCQLITAFRHRDQVVVVMPYQKNIDFREVYPTLSIDGIRGYFRCLFRALRDVHARGIIHRDVKPANFLFDPYTGMGTLCDFGLACRIEPAPQHTTCLHTPYSPKHPHGKWRPRTEYDADHFIKLQREAQQKSKWPSEKVGYPEKDTRPHSKANRAGTRGFRAPEVLFKCADQTGAVDVWAAGVILLGFLTNKFPIFQSNDDVEALLEIATIIGSKDMHRVAMLHNRTFICNVPSVSEGGIRWQKFVETQNPDLYTPVAPDPRFYPHSLSPSASPPSTPDPEDHQRDITEAFDLLNRILEPRSVNRLTPEQALGHEFLREHDKDDNDYVPHPLGQGACGSLHKLDEVGEHIVKVFLPRTKGDGSQVWVQQNRIVSSGQGIAIGTSPCEFHKDLPRKENGEVNVNILDVIP